MDMTHFDGATCGIYSEVARDPNGLIMSIEDSEKQRVFFTRDCFQPCFKLFVCVERSIWKVDPVKVCRVVRKGLKKRLTVRTWV